MPEQFEQAVIVVYKSENGRDNWQPVLPIDVPEWVKEPGTMGKLVAGMECMDPTIGVAGSAWYRATKASAVS
jgi:hypothetical protein